MGALFLSPLYILLNSYLFLRILAWFSTLHSFLGSPWFAVPFLLCHLFTALTPLAALFCRGKWKALTRRISNYWLGMLMYLLIFLLIADLGRILFCLFSHRSVFTPFGTFAYRIIGAVILAASAALSLYGIRHAAQIRITHYDVVIHKSCAKGPLTIALAADLHLGYSVGLKHLKNICAAIEQIQPDLIVYA